MLLVRKKILRFLPVRWCENVENHCTNNLQI